MKKLFKLFAFSFILPINLDGSLTFTLPNLSIPVPVIESKIISPTQGEKIAKLNFEIKNQHPLILSEKNLEIKPTESNFDKEQRLAKEEAERIALEAKKIAQKSKRDVIALEKNRRNDYSADISLEQKRNLTKKAAAQYNIDWRVLEAVWQVESGKSWDTSRKSYAGATGPMQFLPSTFRKYAPKDASIHRAEDSVYAAANLLACAGAASGQVNKALFAYNHSDAYVKKVLSVANSIQD